MIEFIASSEGITRHIARELAKRLQPGAVLALDGPLGAGKTCFIRGLAEGIGIDPRAVSSPTYVICHEYVSSDPARPITLAHLDAYRLSGSGELDSIGWDEMLELPQMIIAIEWAERIIDRVPADAIRIRIAHTQSSPNERMIRMNALGELEPELREVLPAARPTMPDSHCPVCEKRLAPDAPTFPFCSDRCRLIDLGAWLGGRYRLTRPAREHDEL